MQHIKSWNISDAPRLDKDPVVAQSASIRDCLLGEYTQIQDFVDMAETELGNYSYVCRFSGIIYTWIGKFSNIADFVRINPGSHPIERPSLHHFTYRADWYDLADSSETSFFNWRRRQKVFIGHDTWIGHGAVIMPGVSIGNGAVVGSSSVVTRDVAPYTIVVGSPARVLRKRFPDSISSALEKTAWWDWSHQTLKERLDDFRDLQTFLEQYA
ncbi:MAG: acetyltransferase [Desulfonatronovibrio sp.]